MSLDYRRELAPLPQEKFHTVDGTLLGWLRHDGPDRTSQAGAISVAEGAGVGVGAGAAAGALMSGGRPRGIVGGAIWGLILGSAVGASNAARELSSERAAKGPDVWTGSVPASRR